MKKTTANPVRRFSKHAGKLFRLACLLLTFALMHLTALSQNGKVSGKITNAKGEAISGASVTVKATNVITVTDADGNFTITASPTDVLTVSSVGFKTTQISVGNKGMLSASLQADVNTMEDVVVVGYNSQRKNSITGAVSSVNMTNISKTHIPDVAQALQGQVAGVFVAANTGAPGDGIKLRIRGEGTLGNNDALYVVDGVPTRDITFLNPSDIASMTVLKDAASAAIYGSRAASGVVVITTRLGQRGKTNFSVDYFTGFYNAINLPKMLNAEQYLTVKDMAWHNAFPNSTDSSPYMKDRFNGTRLANVNYLDELFTTGIANNIQLSANGGSDKVQFTLSAGYYKQNGIVVENHDMYERFNFRTNVNANVTNRLTLGTNILLSYQKQDKLNSSGDAPGVIRHAMIRPPVLGIYKDPSDPTWSAEDPYTDLPFYTNENGGWKSQYEFSSNPLAIVHFTDDKRKTFQTFGNVFAEFAFLRDKSLKFRSNVGIDIAFQHNKNFASNYGDDNVVGTIPNPDPFEGQGRNNRPNNLDENFGETMTFTLSQTLSYLKNIGDHSINAVVGTENISSKSTGIGGSRQNFYNTSQAFRYLDYGATPNMRSGGSETSWDLVSFFGSGTYSYKNKYFATAAVRADGSSRFGANNKWGYFPSVSAGWIVTQENFMSDVNWLSNLRLRGSWGKAGNQEIPNYAYETYVSQTGGVISTSRYGNPDIKWEETTQTDFGVDMSFLKNKLNISVDYFNKVTDDILLSVGLPAVTVGVIDRTYVNAGSVYNRGLEVSAGYQNNDHKFKYSINGNVGTIKNQVTKLFTYVKNITDNNSHTITAVGQPISSYYGKVFDGIYQNQAEIDKTLFTNSANTKPGDIKFKDLNGDGQINDDDRTYIGNPIPKVTFGASFYCSFRSFDFSFLVQGVQGVDRYNDLKQILDYDSRPFNSTTAVLNAWTGEGTSNTTPRNTLSSNGGGEVSSVFVEDASYVRLKNIELGYTPAFKLNGVNNIRFYISSQNLFTITKYKGLDPESTLLKDAGTYPLSRGILLGAKINL